jgi:hypothetical protein
MLTFGRRFSVLRQAVTAGLSGGWPRLASSGGWGRRSVRARWGRGGGTTPLPAYFTRKFCLFLAYFSAYSGAVSAGLGRPGGHCRGSEWAQLPQPPGPELMRLSARHRGSGRCARPAAPVGRWGGAIAAARGARNVSLAPRTGPRRRGGHDGRRCGNDTYVVECPRCQPVTPTPARRQPAPRPISGDRSKLLSVEPSSVRLDADWSR